MVVDHADRPVGELSWWLRSNDSGRAAVDRRHTHRWMARIRFKTGHWPPRGVERAGVVRRCSLSVRRAFVRALRGCWPSGARRRYGTGFCARSLRADRCRFCWARHRDRVAPGAPDHCPAAVRSDGGDADADPGLVDTQSSRHYEREIRAGSSDSVLGDSLDSLEMQRSELGEYLQPLDLLWRAVADRRIEPHQGSEERAVRKHNWYTDV